MKKSIKYIVLFVVITAISALAGCADITIQAEITDTNFVSYSYVMDFTGLDRDDPNYAQLELFLLDVKEHWEKNGAVGHIQTSDNEITLTGTMEKQCSSASEAFNALFGFMTNEISVFEGASIDYTEENNSANYKIIANMDLSNLVDEQIYEMHPELVTGDVDKFMESITCSVMFTLPYNDTTEAVISQQVTSFDIPFDSSYSMEVTGIINDAESMSERVILLNEQAAIKKNITVAAIIAGVSFILLAGGIAAGVLLKKKGKSTSSEEKEIGNVALDNGENQKE